MKYALTITAILMVLTMTACGPKSAEYGVKGAAGGAVSASFVGAMTDLIVDGKVTFGDDVILERDTVSIANHKCLFSNVFDCTQNLRIGFDWRYYPD